MIRRKRHPVARLADRLAGVAKLVLEQALRVALEMRRKKPERRSNASNRDPHLMDAFRISCESRRLVGEQVTERFLDDHAKSLIAGRRS